MNQCIKCGKNIPDGELFCTTCSQLPVIASLNAEPTPKAPVYPAAKKQTQKSAPKKPAQRTAPKKSERPALSAPFWIVCVLLVGCLSLLLLQQGSLRKEKIRINTELEKMQHQYADAEARLLELDDVQAELDDANEVIAEKDSEIKALTGQLADSKSSQNQGQYDLSNMRKELDALQEDYDALSEEHETTVEELEEAKSYKEKADFMDKYVVFVPTTGTLYHTYACTDFNRSSFWCYSPKLAERMGFTACPKCN